jgi:hypothetical protein
MAASFGELRAKRKREKKVFARKLAACTDASSLLNLAILQKIST